MCFETCGPHEAMVVSGYGFSQPRMYLSGRIWVWPRIQQLQKISLNTMTLSIHSTNIETNMEVPISCIGIAQVKIQGQNREMLENACMQFLGKPESYIQNIALKTMEEHQKAIIGTMTPDEIYFDRRKFAFKMFEVSSLDLNQIGISVVSYSLKDVWDDVEYFAGLSRQRMAQAQKDTKSMEKK